MKQNSQPRFETISKKKLVGLSVSMSLIDNKTPLLWQSFMPRQKEISNRVGADFFSLQVYPSQYFSKFQPSVEFEKWALVETVDFSNIPLGMVPFELSGGLYAVFDYKGTSQQAASFFQYIYAEWLPNSGYELDNRPHFEVLGERYKNNDPNSEEEVWIPVKAV